MRFLLANFYPRTINCYPDELLYFSSAESIWNNGQAMVYNLPSSFTKIGYSLVIAPAFGIQSIKARLAMIALINAAVMSLGIFPVYGIAKNILTDTKRRLVCCFLYVISPTLTYSMTYMSEVLYVPLALMLLYFVYRFIAAENVKGKFLYAVAMIPVLLVSYITKPQALLFPVALAACYMTLGIFGQDKKIKRLSLGCFAVGVFAAMAMIALGFLETDAVLLCDRFLYIIYGFLFFIVITLVAFMFFPIVLPATQRRTSDKKTIIFYLFLICYIVITAAMVAVMIYPKEDYPSLTPRAHIRYVEFLFVPFMIIFLHTLENQAEKKKCRGVWVATVCFALALLVAFLGFSGRTIDQTMLFYWQILSEDGMTFLPYKVRMLSIAIVLVVIIFMRSYHKDKARFEKLFVGGAILLCAANTVLSVYVQYKTHTHTAEETKEAEQMRGFILEHPREQFLLYEPDGYDELLDTFLADCENLNVKLTSGNITVIEESDKRPEDISYIVMHEEIADDMSDAVLVCTYPNLRYKVYKEKN